MECNETNPPVETRSNAVVMCWFQLTSWLLVPPYNHPYLESPSNYPPTLKCEILRVIAPSVYRRGSVEMECPLSLFSLLLNFDSLPFMKCIDGFP